MELRESNHSIRQSVGFKVSNHDSNRPSIKNLTFEDVDKQPGARFKTSFNSVRESNNLLVLPHTI